MDSEHPESFGTCIAFVHWFWMTHVSWRQGRTIWKGAIRLGQLLAALRWGSPPPEVSGGRTGRKMLGLTYLEACTPVPAMAKTGQMGKDPGRFWQTPNLYGSCALLIPQHNTNHDKRKE